MEKENVSFLTVGLKVLFVDSSAIREQFVIIIEVILSFFKQRERFRDFDPTLYLVSEQKRPFKVL